MRQTHRAGERAFIDYSGKRPSIIDDATDALTEVELFVMVLGASNYTYAEATRTQRVPDFTSSIARALEFFGGVPEVLVPDQLRSAVKGPDRYDPDINTTLLELATHYDTAIIPARPRKPRDKAKVETGVLVVQRWILARLRHRKFFSLEELNGAIAELVSKKRGCHGCASLEDLECDAARGIDKSLIKQLASCQWAKAKQNVFITGATGTGKSFLGAALAETACRHGMRALFVRVPRLVEDSLLRVSPARTPPLLASSHASTCSSSTTSYSPR